MNAPDTIRRMADANPVPDAGHLHPDQADAERLFSSIERRRDEMIGTQTRPTPGPTPPARSLPWYRRPALVFLVAAAAVLVVAVPILLFTGGGSDITETPATTAPESDVTTTLPTTTVPKATAPTTPPEQGPLPEPPFALEGWELITPPLDRTGGYDAGAFLQVVATDSGFAANGGAADGVWTSPDGLAWTQVGHPSDPVGLGHPINDFLGLAANSDRIAALVSDGFSLSHGIDPRYGIVTSTDAATWTYTLLVEAPMVEGGDPDPTWPMSIAAYGDDGFIAAGTAIWISTDGEEYRLVHEGILQDFDPNDAERDPYPPRFEFRAIATDGRKAVLGGTGTTVLLVTQDGETWDLIPRLVGFDGEGQACSQPFPGPLAHGPTGFVAVGSCGLYGTVWTSPDGLTWSQIPHDESSFGDPAWLNSITASEWGFVVGGRSGSDGEMQTATVWTSSDGIGWTRMVLGTTEAESGVLGVAIDDDAVVAVGWQGDDAAIWRSVLTN